MIVRVIERKGAKTQRIDECSTLGKSKKRFEYFVSPFGGGRGWTQLHPALIPPPLSPSKGGQVTQDLSVFLNAKNECKGAKTQSLNRSLRLCAFAFKISLRLRASSFIKTLHSC